MLFDLLFYILWGREVLWFWPNFFFFPEMKELSWIVLGVLSLWLSKTIKLPKILVMTYLGYRFCFRYANLEVILFSEINKLMIAQN